MRVAATRQATSGQTNKFAGDFGHEPERHSDDADSFVSESRALVPTGDAAGPHGAAVYRDAAFLAHLIATNAHAPQTRERRRAEPAEALAAYRAVTALTN